MKDLRGIVKDHLDLDHDDSSVSMAESDPATRQKKAQETLRSVMKKHNHQRENRDFKPKSSPKEEKPQEKRELLAKRHQKEAQEGPEDDASLLEEASEEGSTEGTMSRRRGWPRRRRRFFKAVQSVASSATSAVTQTASQVAAAANDGTGPASFFWFCLSSCFWHAATLPVNHVATLFERGLAVSSRVYKRSVWEPHDREVWSAAS